MLTQSNTITQVVTAEQHLPDYKQRYDSNSAKMEAENNRRNFQLMEKIRALSRFSQPAHAVAVLMAAYLGSLLWQDRQDQPPSSINSLIYLASFAFHFGAQMWMTFISGIVLFLTMPRHVFGQVHRHLFPKYFLMNSILGFLTLTTFLQQQANQQWTGQMQTQVWALSIAFAIQLVTRLYVVPPMLQTMQSRMTMEKDAGVGSEVGRYEPGPLRLCQQYTRIHKRFRRLHGLTATANLVAMVCNCIHLYYLANKLSIN